MDDYRDQVVVAIRELAGLMLKEESLEATLARVASLASRTIPGCTAASVTMLRKGQFSTPVATSDSALKADQAQYRADAGPCVESVRGGVIERVHDMADESRWPEFVEAAARVGFGSSMSLPLGVEGVASGALNLYASEPSAFAEADQEVAVLFAEQAGLACVTAERYWGTQSVVEQLEEALKSRDVIGQAKGVLMAQRKITETEAFDVLRTTSQRLNIKLRDLAEQVATTGELPHR
jgi:GAF domain-containing protein